MVAIRFVLLRVTGTPEAEVAGRISAVTFPPWRRLQAPRPIGGVSTVLHESK